jgi:hypothetical protein
MLKGLVVIAKSSGAWKDGRRGYQRAGIDVVVLRSVHVSLQVFTCGEATKPRAAYLATEIME